MAEFPKLTLPDGRIVEEPHVEWKQQNIRWSWLIDSWEGGETYRNAIYGYDSSPLGIPIRNLIRHKREYPDSGSQGTYWIPSQVGADQYSAATNDDYELRRARTPVPTFVSEAIETHLSKIYGQEVERESTDSRITEWWLDVDGKGNKIDEWIQQTVAPLLMVLGQIDILCDHPKVPDGEEVLTRDDQRRLRLDRCVACVFMPGDVVWWELNERDRYRQVIVREWDEYGKCTYRHWDYSGWTLFDDQGNEIGFDRHPFGRVPIIRVFDRKRPRCRNVGKPRYEAIAELQREFYNRDSELILSDTTQAHPLLQGPEDYVQADGTIPVGPGWLLPKKKNQHGTMTNYEGFAYVDPPKGAADSIRTNKSDLRDAADRAALLTKPAGAAGTTGDSVAQSGISKRLDQASGNDLLATVATVLESAERAIVELAYMVLTNGKELAEDAVEIVYPRAFDLYSLDELTAATVEFQAILASAGSAPVTEQALLTRIVRLLMPGLDDGAYEIFDEEIEAALKTKSELRSAHQEASMTVLENPEQQPEPMEELPPQTQPEYEGQDS